jgi:hypothetical protein
MGSKRYAHLLALLVAACSTSSGTQSPAIGDGGSDGATTEASALDAASVDAVSLIDSSAPDAGDGCASSQPEAGAWTPADLGASLALWLDPGSIQGSGGKLVRWNDRSSNHNDATPISGAPAIDTAKIHGFDAVDFNGYPDGIEIADAPSLWWGFDDYLVEVVVAYTNMPAQNETTGYAGLWIHGAATSPYWGPCLFANAYSYFADGGLQPAASVFYAQVRNLSIGQGGGVASAAQGYNDGQFHLAGMRRHGAILDIRVGGSLSRSGSVDVHDMSAKAQHAYIGGQAGGQFLLGSIVEVVAVHAVPPTILCDSDVAALEGYLLAKYGL